ncbi:MAG: hypothetical protein ACJAVI_005595 [Candidatus Azotimanducaceae bacterium]|jgi:hypothetical protein
MDEALRPRSPLVITLCVVLALLLVWPIWIAAHNGLSGLYARPAVDYLEGKRFDAYTVSEAQWQALENNLVHADQLMPDNPQYLQALGLLQQLKLRMLDGELSVEAKDAHASAAKSYFQRAVESRPTWPYYWGNLALEHYRSGNYASDEYSQALANTARFGPWKNDTQRLVIDLGSETWKFLSPSARREFILSVERGLHRQPQNTVLMVGVDGAWPAFCEASRALPDVALPHLLKLCENERFAE